MDFFEVIQMRRSTRAFQVIEVEEEKLSAILECALSAPSAGNLQSYSILVVKERDRKLALARAALGQEFVAAAPVVLGFFREDCERSAARYGSGRAPR